MKPLHIAAMLAFALLLRGPARAAETAPAGACPSIGGVSFICGIDRPEDLQAVPGGRWVIASGMAGPDNMGGGLHLVDAGARAWTWLYPGAAPKAAWDRKRYPDCAGAPDPRTFSAHGISLKVGPGGGRLYAVNHGREAIEVFDLKIGAGPPAISWVGCLRAPAGASLNAVVEAPDGTVFATSMVDAPAAMQDVMAGKPTGQVYAWGPGSAEPRKLPGTHLAGDNGVEVSPDGRWLYLALTGTAEVMRFDLAHPDAAPASVKVGFGADNLRWDGHSKLLVAGQTPPDPACTLGRACPRGYGVKRIDPETLQASVVLEGPGIPHMSGLATALPVGQALWLGGFGADRIAIVPAP